MSNAAENISKIESEITELVSDLYEILSLDPSDAELKESHALERYIKRVARIGLSAGKEGLIALQDVCVIYRQILHNLQNSQIEFTEQIRYRLEEWPTQALSLLSSPVDDDLYESIVNFYEDPIWPQILTNEDKAFLRNEISPESLLKEDANSISAEPNTLGKNEAIDFQDDADFSNYSEDYITVPFDNISLEAVQQEILETMADLLVDLGANTDGQVISEYADSLNLCADRMELVGVTVATMGFMGLMDACQYFQFGLRQLACSDEPMSTSIQSVLEEWPTVVITYLTLPDEMESIKGLVEYVKSINWTPKLMYEELSALAELLLEDGLSQKKNEQSTYSDDKSGSRNEAEEISQTTSDDVQDTHDEIEIDEESDSHAGERLKNPNNELIEIVRKEIEINIPELKKAVTRIANNADSRSEAVASHKSLIERLVLASDSIGLFGLTRILGNINSNIETLCADALLPSDEQKSFLLNWPYYVTTYLQDVSRLESCSALVKAIQQVKLPVEIDIPVEQLLEELSNPTLIEDEEIEQRATRAHSEDVSLKLPEDVNQQLLETLLHELPGQTAEFTAIITRFVMGNARMQEVEVAQRIAHTLKGSANTVGVTGIATLTHHIEDILTAFVKHERLPGAGLSDVLMNAADILEAMSESLLGIGPAPDQAQNVLQEILDWANRIDNIGIDEIDDDTVTTHSEDKLQTQEPQETRSEEFRADESNIQTMLRVPAALMDNLLRLVGESIILSGQLHEKLHQLSEQTRLEQEQNKLFQQLCFELEQITDIKGMVARGRNGTFDEVFDALELEQYNELHTVTHRLVEAATDARELTHGIEDGLNALDGLLLNQNRLQKETQETVMRTRMVPVQNIVPRLHRTIRQTCRFTGKQAALEVVGADTMIDSDVLDDLVDPLMHVIRNAIDHGIENPDIRVEKGKDPKGIIQLDFSRQGDHINVSCTDDGVGLNYDAIRATAILKGMINKDDNPTEDELVRMIWLPGFTTKEQTTQISGRGIGMDAVHNQISAMKGSLNINSTHEVGTTVELKLPLTLISMHALLVSAYNQNLAISTRGIEQILTPGEGDIERNDDETIIHIEDETYSVTDLETLLHLPYNRESSERTVLLVRDETGNMSGISLDKVLASKDLVVKNLGPYVPEIPGIEGATILGDGSVAPVIDLLSLLRGSMVEVSNPWIEQLEQSMVHSDAPCALIVDDSLSARRSLAEFIKDLGYQILTAKDGIEAIDVLDSKTPDIMLVDLEMPRMNGVELTAHVRADEKIHEMPIIMITSRTTEKHQSMANSAGVTVYLTKPFSEDTLMEHINDLYRAPEQIA
jgi:chemosensory pili system protein ChpA (sensor histidine kinase/response regulator)